MAAMAEGAKSDRAGGGGGLGLGLCRLMARRARAVEPDPIPPRPTRLSPAGPLRAALSTDWVGSSKNDIRSPGGPPPELLAVVRLEPPLNPSPAALEPP